MNKIINSITSYACEQTISENLSNRAHPHRISERRQVVVALRVAYLTF